MSELWFPVLMGSIISVLLFWACLLAYDDNQTTELRGSEFTCTPEHKTWNEELGKCELTSCATMYVKP